jgi:hypothetical protein
MGPFVVEKHRDSAMVDEQPVARKWRRNSGGLKYPLAGISK